MNYELLIAHSTFSVSITLWIDLSIVKNWDNETVNSRFGQSILWASV
jgi:hypothetical protein